ncbi:ABC transporter permease subunit [Pseudaminobacter soli (ex Li et al. 2025)]|uniref:ABC transporter n=1 Tax=Pseudaminobacter soli (ex Li et al. 2025) TaxID=1295366 RepID=A0A2P7SFZ4_9HYPH|nr:ABC transporter permease subunit [Mesorhizobium soli]PSJ61390.1 ABC transporter [Mesorhizobium soli]
MLLYVFRRLLTAIPTLFVIVTLAFFLIRVAPGGPFNQERGLSPVIKANLEAQFGLNDPLWQQYLNYLNNLLHGNFGPSYNMPDFTVGELFAKGLPISIQLGTSALILALILGSTLGVIAALNQNRRADYSVIALAAAGSTIPTFVIAPIIQLVFGLSWKLLPIGGWGDGALINKVGPVLTLALPQIAIIARLMRGSMIESMRSHHIRTARALGLSEWSVVVKHALRGAVLPIISYAGPTAAALLTGSVIVETIFAIPGVGRYFVEAALNRDYTLVMGTVVMIAIFTILFNLIVDVLYAFVDPRVRYD